MLSFVKTTAHISSSLPPLVIAGVFFLANILKVDLTPLSAPIAASQIHYVFHTDYLLVLVSVIKIEHGMKINTTSALIISLSQMQQVN